MKRFLLLIMASVFVLSISAVTMAAEEKKADAKPTAATEAKPAAAAEAKPAATDAKPAAAEAKPAATDAKPAAATEAKPAAAEAKPAAAEAKPASAADAKPAATDAKPAAATEAKPAATEAKPAAAEAKPAAAVNLTGKWTSSLIGEVSIEQTGNKIVGTYQYKDDDDVTQDGKFEGTVEGKMVKGKWFERAKVGSGAESRGQMEWKIADDGKILVGWYLSEGDTEKQDWNLER